MVFGIFIDKTIIYSKIESLQRCINRIREKTPNNVKSLKEDWDIQDIIVLNLERAVQICVDIAAHIIAELDRKTPLTMADAFIDLQKADVVSMTTAKRLVKSVAFRNIAVRRYQEIDWDIVYAIVTLHLSDFKTFSGEIFRWLDKH